MWQVPDHKTCSDIAFTPDGKYLIADGIDGTTLAIWDIAARKRHRSIQFPRGGTLSFSLSVDEKTLVTWGATRPTTVYDFETGKEIVSFNDCERTRSVALSPDGKSLAAGNTSKGIYVWDVAAKKLRFSVEYPGRSGHLNVVFSADSKTLYSLGSDGILTSWDASTGKSTREVKLREQLDDSFRHMVLSSDGKTMAVISVGTVRFVDVEAGKIFTDHDRDEQWGNQRCLCFSPDGKLLATGSSGRDIWQTVYLWDVPTRKK